jgi:lipopolysaccharide export system protein LptA
MFRGLMFFFFLSNLFSDDRLFLKQANMLESKRVKEKNVKEISGDVIFTKGDLTLKCQKGQHIENLGIVILYDEVSSTKEELSFVADTLKFYSVENQLLGIGNSHAWTPEYDLKADSIIIFTKQDSGIASGNVTLIQNGQVLTAEKIVYKSYPDLGEISYTAFGNVVIKDSVVTATSGIARYSGIDQNTYLNKNPKIFDEDRVLIGDEIKLEYHENILRSIYIPSNAIATIQKEGFVKIESDSSKQMEKIFFNDEMEGKELFGSFSEGALDSLAIYGMSKTLYNVFEDSSYKGNNIVSGDTTFIDFSNNKLNSIVVVGGAEGIYLPDPSTNNISFPVKYSADKMKYLFKNKKTDLYGNSIINHDNTSLESGYININWENDILSAYPNSNSDLKKELLLFPIIKEKNKDPMTGSQMTYNLKTKKGRIKKGSTRADDGYYTGKKIQNESSKIIFIENSTYTTCDLDTAHFHFESKNMKIVQNDIVVARPIILHISQIPVLGIPFGIFPHKGGQRHSGWIMPSYGDNKNRGQYIQGLGFYWAPNDYWDSKLTMGFGDKQGYTFKVNTQYNLRYKFNGSLNFFNRQFLSGTKNITDIFGDKKTSTTVRWNHKQIMRNNQSLNANITYSTSGDYNKKYGLTESERMDQKAISNISYSKRWPESKNSISLSYYANQDLLIRDKIDENSKYYINPNRKGTQINSKNQTFPKFSFRHGQSDLFSTTAIDKKWFNTITWNYGLNYSNIKRVYYESVEIDSNMFSWKNEDLVENKINDENNGWIHTSSINAPQKLFRYISINPRLSLKSAWVNKTYDGIWNDSLNVFEKIEKNRFATRTTGSFSLNSSTQIYGLIPIPLGPVKSIRHVMSPTIGYSWTPDFSENFLGKDLRYFRKRFTGDEEKILDRFSGTIAGNTPKSEQKSMTFGINNIFQAKILKSKEEKKVDLLNWRINSGYNFAADSLKFSNIRSSVRSKILGKLNVDLGMTHDLYNFDVEKNKRLASWNKNSSGKIVPRLINARLSTSFKIKSKKWDENELGDNLIQDTTITEENLEEIGLNTVPRNIQNSISNNQLWSTNISLSYSLNALNPDRTSKTFWANSNSIINITNNWKVSYRARFDLMERDLVNHSFSIYRDLHCWELSLNWTPNGIGQGINFKINVKSPTLKDLKLEKKGGVYSGAGI